MKTAEEIAEKYVRGNHDALTDNQEIKDMAADIEEYASIKAEQARREEREKSFEMLEKWSILNKEHYRDVSDLIQKTREIIEKTTTIQVMTQKQRERKLSEEDRKLIRRAMGLY